MLRPQSFLSHIQTDNILLALELIRRQPGITKSQISRDLEISVQGATNIFRRLQKGQFIQEISREYSGRGKPAQGYVINADSGYAIGFHLDHQCLIGVLTDLQGNIIEETSVPCHFATPEIVAPLIEHLVCNLVRKHQIPDERFFGVSIAMSGPFNVPGMTSSGPTTLPEWQNCDFEQMLKQRIHSPVYINNESSVAAMYELLFGNRENLNNFLFIYFGLGLGGGLILNGQPFLGTKGNAGEIGHTPVDRMYEEQCSCGNHGCLEQFFSLHGFYTALKKHGLACDSHDQLSMLMEDRNPALLKVLDDSTLYLKQAVQTFENLLDLDAIFLAGLLPENILTYIETKLSKLNPSINNGKQSSDRIIVKAIQDNAIAHAAAVYPLFKADNQRFWELL